MGDPNDLLISNMLHAGLFKYSCNAESCGKCHKKEYFVDKDYETKYTCIIDHGRD